jgi:hypothetical protein
MGALATVARQQDAYPDGIIETGPNPVNQAYLTPGIPVDSEVTVMGIQGLYTGSGVAFRYCR